MRRLATACAIAGLAAPAGAQSMRVADSLFQAGSLVRAESLYYRAAAARPHDPIVRWSLGRFLIARGAVRVGATLLEESLKFGGEPSIVGRDLVMAYTQMGSWADLAALSSATFAERQRARWFVAHTPSVVAPDSVIVAEFRTSDDTTVLGRIPIRVNGRTIDAVVSAKVQGILIADTSAVARSLRTFGAPRGQAGRVPVLAAADSMGMGRMELIGVPVTIDRLDKGDVALIGLATLGRFAPTFDPGANRVTLRTSGSVSPRTGQRFDTRTIPSDLSVARAGGWMSVTRLQIARLLREHRWTLDAKRGQLVVEP